MNVGLRCLKPMHCFREFNIVILTTRQVSELDVGEIAASTHLLRAGFETLRATSERGNST